MTYDAALTTTRDNIRLIVGDTSNDVLAEIFPDTTYDAQIAGHVHWKLAAASMAEATAVKIEQNPTSVSFPQDMSVGWSDRTRTLRATASQLRAEANAEIAGVGTLTSTRLHRDGTNAGAEYRASHYRLLRR